jgi:uracil-DNA glycosylase
MKPVLLIGQAPSRRTAAANAGAPFSGRSGKFLADLIGIERADFARAFEFRNVFTEFPGAKPSGRGDRFPTRLAGIRAAAAEIAGSRQSAQAQVS